MELFSLVFICMWGLPFGGEMLQEVEVVALLAGRFRFFMTVMAVGAGQVA